MVDVLLSHSNYLFSDEKQVRKMQPYPPLQTLIAAALLRAEGFEVALFDATLEEPRSGFTDALDRYRPKLVAICEDNFNFLTKMCLARNRELALWMAQEAARAGVPAVVNGSDATDHAELYLSAGFATVIAGELEQSLLDVCRKAPAASPRIMRPARPANIDALPATAWDLVDMARYRTAWKSAHAFFEINMVASRGCPFRCNWCAKPLYGDTYRCRSARLVAGEMQHVKTAYRPDRIWFADDIFALPVHWAREFADEVERRDARVPFKMQSRADLMTRNTVADLRRAGCDEVWMGVESGSQRILDAMDKGIRLEHVHQARENLKRHGIRACFFLQFGYLGETREDIDRTIRLVRETKPDDIGVSVSYPLPGTRFHQIVSGGLRSKQNWSHSGDLEVMFDAAFPSEYYRNLADSLHAEVRSWTSC